MPYLVFRAIWTPLTFIGIRFYREIETNNLYIKIGKNKRRRLFKKRRK